MDTQHITILHSNDIHADYLPATDKAGRNVGGIAYLAGYVAGKREENPESTLYVFSGDMFKGNLADLESKGMETIRIMNRIRPDVATIGNHELDYQLSCLDYYTDRCKFPLINANMYDKFSEDYYFKPYQIIRAGELTILFIGVITEDIEARKAKDFFAKMNMEWRDPKEQIEKVVRELKKDGIHFDLVVILSHLGFEEDRNLAKELADDVKVDLIIGGHSHTFLKEPQVEKGIRIVQAGEGTGQIGRFEIEYDLKKKEIASCDWSLDPILNNEIRPDTVIQEKVTRLDKEMKKKYHSVLSHLEDENHVIRDADNHTRYAGTEVGNLVCDALKEHYDLDAVLIGSGSLRQKTMRQEITKAEIMEMYPYDDEKLYMVYLKGEELKTAVKTFLENAPANEGQDGEDHHEEFYQISYGFYFEYSKESKELRKATWNGKELEDDEILRVGMEGYHLKNADRYLGLKNLDEIRNRSHNGRMKRKKSSSIKYSLKEYVREHGLMKICSEVRLKIV